VLYVRQKNIMTSARIPIWKAGGIAMIAYLVTLIWLTAAAKSDQFWNEMFVTPRFRTGFIFYSLPFFIVGVLLIAVGRWVPTQAALVVSRRVVIGLSIFSLFLAGCLMLLFGSGFDFKLSGP